MGQLGTGEYLIISLMCLLPAIILIAVALLLVNRRRQAITTQRVQCPFCAEWIMPQAKICRYCGRDLPLGSSSENE
jgi:hypothetical protein